MLTQLIPNEIDMLAFGSRLALACEKTLVIYLYGDLGAGKTTLARGFLRGLGYTDKVKSPTYTIVEPYTINQQSVFHFDLYRIHHPEELEYLGIRDYLPGIYLIEWPEHGAGLLPTADLSCYIGPHTNGRQVRIMTHTPQGQITLQRLLTNLC